MNRPVNFRKWFFDSAAGLSHGWMSFLYEISYRMTSKICNCLEMPLFTVSLRMGFLMFLSGSLPSILFGDPSLGAHEEWDTWPHCRGVTVSADWAGFSSLFSYASLLCLPMRPAGPCCMGESGAQRTRSEWPWNTSPVVIEACLQWTSLP